MICVLIYAKLFDVAEIENPKVEIILVLLAAGAILTLALIAPGVPGAIYKLSKQFKRYPKKRLRQIIKRIADQELVSFKEEGGEVTVKLTEKGKLKVLKYNIDNLKIEPPEKWDEKWRIVLFDIPEAKKVARNALRRKLKDLGFYQFQKSAFIYPFECKNEISFIRANYEVKNYVKYIVAAQLEEENFFKSWFGVN